MVDISALLSDQPLVNEGNEEGGGEELDTSLEGGSDYSGGEPPEAEGTDEPAESERKHVPLAALHQERSKRQQLEQEAQQLRQSQAQTMERLTKLLEAQQQAQQPKEEVLAPPSFVDDPEAAFNHVQQQLAATQRQMQDYLNGTQQQHQAQQQHQVLAQEVSMQEIAYTQTVPDYPQAADFFYNRKVAEYAAFTGNEIAAKQQVANDYAGIARLAKSMGKNPAELMYNAAKAMGYTPGQQQQAPVQHKQPNTSLSNLQGSPRAPDETGKITAADVSNMSEAEFDKLWKSMSSSGATRPKV
jgi:hypothetical protein